MNLTGLAASLADRGVDIGFLAPPRFRDHIASQFRVVDEFEEPARRALSDDYYEDFLAFQGLNDPALLESWIATELAAIERFSPDVLVSDLQLTSAVSAEVAGVLHVGIARWTEHSRFTSPVSLRRFGDARRPRTRTFAAFDDVLARHGVRPLQAHPWELAFERSQLAIAPSSPTIERELAQLGDSHFVGYLTSPSAELKSPFDRRADLRILCYLSDKGVGAAEVVEALKPLSSTANIDVIIVDPSSDIAGRPENWVRHVRHLDALPLVHTDVLVCAGTRGVSQEALMSGVGLVFAETDTDDELDFTARRLAELGAGVRVQSLRPQLAEAVVRANDTDTRLAAHELGEELLMLGGPGRAAELIIRLPTQQTSE